MPDNQLKITVIGPCAVDSSRSVAKNSLSIYKMHLVGRVAFSSPVISSPQHNNTVPVVEFQTLKSLIIVITDLYFPNLS
jgi:hypothetical protein